MSTADRIKFQLGRDKHPEGTDIASFEAVMKAKDAELASLREQVRVYREALEEIKSGRGYPGNSRYRCNLTGEDMQRIASDAIASTP